MSVPYTLEPRADTRVSNTTLGFWLFLASEVMLFGALFSAYALLRVAAPEWPSGRDVLNTGLGALNTVVLLAGTALIWRARRVSVGDARRLMLFGTAAAVMFLALKTFEYQREIADGLLPSRNTFLAVYYVLTGVHVVHVAAGAIANLWAWAGRAGDAMAMNRIRLLAMYWAFVDVVWLLIFATLYL